MSSHFSDLRVLDSGRSVELHCDTCFVDGDPSLLERVFANLASNVHRHTPESARVIASCKTQHDAVQCIIEDAGPGLDDRQMQHLAAGTERFGHLGSGDRHGTGLGLFLVASIIRSHGGTASFTRGDLGGLRVSLTLPETPPGSPSGRPIIRLALAEVLREVDEESRTVGGRAALQPAGIAV